MRNALFAATALAAAVMTGCKDEPRPNPAPTPAPAPAPATQPAGPATQPISSTPAAPTTPGTPTIPSIPSTPSLPVPTLPSTPAVPAAPSTPATPETPSASADDVQTKAKNWMDEANKSLKAGKFDDAMKAVDQLDGIKSKLSPEWQAKIDQLKAAVEQAKKLKVPGLGS